MDIEEGIKRINGTVEVEIQGFFTERFINLCKINNIKIWDIKNIVSGIVRFNISLKDFKKLKKVSKKTKCKVTVINKRGLYFKLFKYRKRAICYLLIFLFVILCVFSTTFVWNIEVVGNETIPAETIIEALKEAGLYVGKNKINLKTKNVINSLRINVTDIAWAGIEIDGTDVCVKVVEKTDLEEDNRDDGTVGDIVSTKAGIIEKITVENGSAIASVGDYIESGRILIEGKIYSKYSDTKDVKAKGEVILKTNYEYSNTYYFNQKNKKYTGKKKYSIGITINDKENYINYLDKSLNYDIIKNGWSVKILGLEISFDFYTFELYDLEDVVLSKDELLNNEATDAKNYIDELLPTLNNAQVVSSETVIDIEDEEKISIRTIYTVTEEDGVYRKRN